MPTAAAVTEVFVPSSGAQWSLVLTRPKVPTWLLHNHAVSLVCTSSHAGAIRDPDAHTACCLHVLSLGSTPRLRSARLLDTRRMCMSHALALVSPDRMHFARMLVCKRTRHACAPLRACSRTGLDHMRHGGGMHTRASRTRMLSRSSRWHDRLPRACSRPCLDDMVVCACVPLTHMRSLSCQ